MPAFIRAHRVEQRCFGTEVLLPRPKLPRGAEDLSCTDVVMVGARTVLDNLAKQVTSIGTKPALSDNDGRLLTFDEVWRCASSAAQWLAAYAGVGARDLACSDIYGTRLGWIMRFMVPSRTVLDQRQRSQYASLRRRRWSCCR